MTSDIDAARMQHFRNLDHEQQAEAIRLLALAGMTEHGIANATRLSVEQVRRVLSERQAA